MDIKNGELFLFATRKKFGMQEGIKMSELPAQPIDACCRIQYVLEDGIFFFHTRSKRRTSVLWMDELGHWIPVCDFSKHSIRKTSVENLLQTRKK